MKKLFYSLLILVLLTQFSQAFERFIEKFSSDFSDSDYEDLEQILDIPDSELFDIILKKKYPPANLKNLILFKILEFCNGKL